MQRYLLTALIVFSHCESSFAQDLQTGQRAFVLSQQPVKALMDDGAEVVVPFGQLATVEEVVPNYIAVRFQGQYALLDPDVVLGYEDAKKYLEDLLKRKPTSQNYAIKARVEHNLRNLDTAISDADAAIELDPNNAFALTIRSSAYSLFKEFDTAEQDVDRALEIDPNFDQANSVKFYILQNTNRKEEALKFIEKAVQINPHRALYHSNRGSVLLQLGKNDEGVASFKKAIEVEPAYNSGYYFMGYHYNRIGKRDEARGYFERSAALHPKHYWSHYYLARYALEDGDINKHIKHLGLSTEAIDAPISAKNSYAWKLSTSTIDSVRDGQKAIEIAKKLVEGSVEHEHQVYQYLKTLAAAYAEAGEFEKATETLDKIDFNRYRDNMIADMYEKFQEKQPFRQEDY